MGSNRKQRSDGKALAKDRTLQRLLSFSLKDPRPLQRLRREAAAAPSDTEVQIVFALALGRAGCTYEAASILRPLQNHWKSTQALPLASEAVAAQSWWNKNWRQFVRLRRSNKEDAALALLGDRVLHYWDLPPLLAHLGEIAANCDQLDLASHLFHRLAHLSERGLPKMNMQAFGYVSQAALVDLMCKRGEIAAALDRHRVIVPSPGNAMAHEFQHARLLVAAGHIEEAMRTVASMLVTAQKHRTGYGKQMRIEFIETAPELGLLRKRADWEGLVQDPDAYLRSARQ